MVKHTYEKAQGKTVLDIEVLNFALSYQRNFGPYPVWGIWVLYLIPALDKQNIASVRNNDHALKTS